jgi:hypothetical protein
MGYTAGNLDGVTTSAMAEICRVNLQFAAVRRGMVPFGANLPANHLNAGVNRRFGVLFVCCCVAADDAMALQPGSEAAVTGGWGGSDEQYVRACTDARVSAHDAVQTRSGAGRRLRAHFGMFAAAVCAQVMCWAFGVAEKLPLQGAEEMTKSSECVRALVAWAGVCGAFKRALAPAADLMLNFGLFAARVGMQVMRWLSDLAQKLSARLAEWMTKERWVLEVRTYV